MTAKKKTATKKKIVAPLPVDKPLASKDAKSTRILRKLFGSLERYRVEIDVADHVLSEARFGGCVCEMEVTPAKSAINDASNNFCQILGDAEDEFRAVFGEKSLDDVEGGAQ